MKSRTPVDRSKVRIKKSPIDESAALLKRGNLQQLDWCPAQYREEYRSLRRKRLGKAEARRIIEDHIKRRPK